MSGLSAVVVNYNAATLLADCVRSLRAEGVEDVVVVDNSSSDDSAAVLAAADPDARWVPTGGNLGFGGGANRGAAVTAPDAHLLVCNPDITLEPGSVKALLGALEAEPGVGIVGARIENPDGTVYPSPRVFPGMLDAMGHALVGLFKPDNQFTRRYRMLDVDRSVYAGDVDWVSGSCFLARREAWDQLGGFDDSYFMYAEDLDLCWRAHKLGWRVAFEPGARAVHVQGHSTDQRAYRMIVEHHRSLWKFTWRTTTGWRRALLPVVAAGLALRAAVACGQRAMLGVRAR
ncbi:MAG TPA: glycosyltransferase family 2 protein [Acidimicrobiales bacterium]|nr:glycosyltransferase family 2 protein [Acidimicrobiales bacterium]